jgi:FkbM family methyltransferase
LNKEHIIAQAMLRAWPFPRGAGRLTDKFFSGLRFSRETVTVTTSDGFSMTIFPNDHIGRHIYLTGEFDRSNVEVLINFSEAGDVLLDIGANCGYVSACFLHTVRQSRVIAVEPQPAVYGLLKQNLERFGSGRQISVPVAVSEHDTTAWFELCEGNTGGARLVDHYGPSTTKIDVWSAETLFQRLEIHKIDLVKIDVEGHEEPIIRACQNAFARLQPRAILFEDHGSAQSRIALLLREIGYRVFGLRKSLTRLDLIETSGHFNDYVAVKDGRRMPAAATRFYGV